MIIFKLPVILFTSILLIFFLYYLALPTPPFPAALPDSVQSLEDADTETPYRRSYFTNKTREEVVKHYEEQLSQTGIFGISITPYRLNYPPEEAFSLIRDQTRSTFLEELVHPFRESLYVNGFKPRVQKDDIWYKGIHFEQKITVKYITSEPIWRIVIYMLSFVLLLFLLKEFFVSLKKFIQEIL